MSSNKELVAQAVAAIPLWRAFLDAKEAEQDALLAEVRNEQPPESKTQQLLGSFTQAWRSKQAPADKPEPEDLKKAGGQEQEEPSPPQVAPPIAPQVASPIAQPIAQQVAPPIAQQIAPPIAPPKDPPEQEKITKLPAPLTENDLQEEEFEFEEEEFDSEDEEEFNNLF